jgi:hypothetical protein
MTKLSKDIVAGTLHPRESLTVSGTLGALNAEVITDCDGSATVAVDLRGTFSMTVEVSGTVDGTNWILIPVRSAVGGAFLSAIVGTASGVWMASCSGFDRVRARVTAHTSGSATATLLASTSLFDDFAKNGSVTSTTATTVGSAPSTATTLTIASPGAGLRHYLTYISISRFAAALLVAAAAPVTVTTTNIPGALAISFPAEAALQGTIDRRQEDFALPIMTTAQGTATTIVCPATTNVIWRITAGFYVAP